VRAIGDTIFDVLKTRREVVVACWSAKIRAAVGEALSTAELLDHIPAFVDEIIAALYPGAVPLHVSSGNAGEHGAQRLRLQFNVAEVVREYGLLHECIIELAREHDVQIDLAEQQVIGKWLNTGIADAIDQYVKRRDTELERRTSEHLGFIAHELRNPLSAARAAAQGLRRKTNGDSERVADLLERSLRRSADMIDNALSHASLKLGADPNVETIAVGDLLRDIEEDAGTEAQARAIALAVDAPAGATITGDPRLLRSAIFNLVQNALKFSRPRTHVTLRAERAADALTIEIADECGGLPPGKIEDLFAPLVQRGANRSGFGLGLSIARQAVEAHGGTIGVRDVPGAGCVFTIRLPQMDAGNQTPEPRIER
jgi:signal transduction histidine kinase